MKRLINLVYGERLSKYRIEENVRAYGVLDAVILLRG